MTPEQRISQLEADLARERAISDDLRAQVRVFMARIDAETSQKTARRERNARHRLNRVSGDVSSSSHETSQSPSPSSPLPSSFPPSPAPSSPYPLSFPPSSPPPGSTEPSASVSAEELPMAAEDDVHEAEERPALVLVAQKPEKLARKPSKAEELYANLQAHRRERCEKAGVQWFDDGWKSQRMNAALGPVVRLDEAGKQSFADGWDEYLADDAGAVKDPPWSLGYFLASRSSWESKAARRAP